MIIKHLKNITCNLKMAFYNIYPHKKLLLIFRAGAHARTQNASTCTRRST